MKKRPKAVLFLGIALILGGCATHQDALTDLPAQELAGHYVSAPGASWFTPCNAAPADAPWWVTVTGRAVEQFARARAAGQWVTGQRYFVKWRAAITTTGQIGPHGPGKPALLVREVLELRPASETDCVDR